ncbi:hypothetical protein [uncultured Campylobacter sp.]|nr:hypothetical protein [uncultured Campylobacter sp.]
MAIIKVDLQKSYPKSRRDYARIGQIQWRCQCDGDNVGASA